MGRTVHLFCFPPQVNCMPEQGRRGKTVVRLVKNAHYLATRTQGVGLANFAASTEAFGCT
jgi:hypothetical protein